MMEYAVKYSPAALDDLRAIYSYIAYKLLSPRAAENTVNRIRNDIRKLNIFPEKHRQVEWEPWASMGMRLMPVKNYIVYYMSDSSTSTVTIVRIFYGGRDVEHIIRDRLD